ncbi:MAG: DUF362 domain-containing protein [Nanoarchaeota archaeon]
MQKNCSSYKVSIEKCQSYDRERVKKALDNSLRNIDFKLKKNMKVLIKPNLLIPEKPENAITTNPIILEELCKILQKFNAQIFIGDSSSHDTKDALEICGIKKLSKYATIINFEDYDKKIISFKDKKIILTKTVFDFDIVINVAKMKTHGLTGVSLCIKNLYGLVPGKTKSFYHKLFPNAKEFSDLLFRIYEEVKPELNIIDGIEGIEGEGPGKAGKKTKSQLIIAGTNAEATDIIASEIMGFKPFKIYTNKLSKIKREQIKVLGSGKDVKLNFQKPNSFPKLAFFMLRLFPNPKIKINRDKCKLCRLCEKKCPINAISFNNNSLNCMNEKCIKCFCCIEVCPNNAIYLKENFIKSLMVNLGKKILKRE